MEQNPMESRPPDDRWARETLTELAGESLKERQRARRWKIFFRLLLLGIVALLVLVPAAGLLHLLQDHTALVKLDGVIYDDAPASTDNILDSLQTAFENEYSKAVILEINSPGGSPVQAAQINEEIHHLRESHPDKPLYAVITDICASGGYYVAVASDSIYADKSSLVGSIGVIFGGFGFVNAMKTLGIERRVATAGKNKNMFDPFLPENPESKVHLQKMLNQAHELFIARVKRDRGDRLANDSTVFSGLVWTGEEAMSLGLIDGFGSVRQVAREVIGIENVVEYRQPQSLMEQFTSQIGTHVSYRLINFMLNPLPG